MESIYPLITLPKPLDTETGRTQLSAISAFTKSRKRKRYEVAAAVDGDSIIIYNIQTPSQISSYAVSPDTHFACAPCSVVTHTKKDNLIVRRTFCAAQESLRGAVVIKCFEEVKAGKDSAAPQVLSWETSQLSPVLALEAIQTSSGIAGSGGDYEILVLYRNGAIECLDCRLTSLLWTSTIPDCQEGISDFLLTDGESVRKGLFEDRADIVSQLEGHYGKDATASRRTPVLCILQKSMLENVLVISVLAIRPRNKVTLGYEQPIQHLITFDSVRLPDGCSVEKTLSFSWSIKAGLLHAASSNLLATFSLAKSVPVLVSTISDPGPAISSHIALNGSSVLTQSDTHFTLYDTTYSSIEDRIPQKLKSSSKKRKRSNDDKSSQPALSYVNFFPKLGLVVAFQDRELLAIQLNPVSTVARSRKLGLLADAIWKGARPKRDLNSRSLQSGPIEIIGVPAVTDSDDSWPKMESNLRKMATQGDVSSFERLFAQAVGFELVPNGHGSDGLVEWVWDDPATNVASTAPIHQSKAFLALRLMFEVHGYENEGGFGEDSKLSIRFFAPNTFHWLAVTSLLTVSFIEQALRKYPEDEGFEAIGKTSLVESLVDFDPTLDTLCTFIEAHPHLDIDDLAQSIKFIVQSYDKSTLPTPRALLTNGDEHLPNGAEERSVDEEVDDAMDDLDVVMHTLESETSLRNQALSKALTAMNAFSSNIIVAALRSALSHHDLIFLIWVLRLELLQGGWTSRYIDPRSSVEEDESSFNHTISVVSHLLSCAVDAVGMTGWLATSATDPIDSVDVLLETLRAETSAALEGAHEATYLQGLLTEFLQYGARTKKAARRKENRSPNHTKHSDDQRLPLGMKVDTISLTKFSGGREVQRSKRAIGQQISRKVPPYSVDKIYTGPIREWREKKAEIRRKAIEGRKKTKASKVKPEIQS